MVCDRLARQHGPLPDRVAPGGKVGRRGKGWRKSLAAMNVSVLLPAYNVAACIERAIRSALDQSLAPAEVVVVDDGSTDSTCEVVSRLGKNDTRIKLVRQPVNRGPAAARNLGIERASGDWIAILDADDAFLRHRLGYLVDAAERCDLTFAADNVTLFDSGAQRATGPGIEPDRIGSCLELDRYTFVRNAMTNQPGSLDFGLLKPVMRRDFLMSKGVRYPEDCRHGEDFVFYLRAIMAGARFRLFPLSGYLYTQRRGSISRKQSDLSRTVVNYRLMEQQTRQLALEPAVRVDPLLSSLLVARADKIKALYRTRELRDLLRRISLFDLARQVVRHADARAFVSGVIRRKLMKLTSSWAASPSSERRMHATSTISDEAASPGLKETAAGRERDPIVAGGSDRL
jgi:succinoglycan biosynthesis protein ExoO